MSYAQRNYKYLILLIGFVSIYLDQPLKANELVNSEPHPYFGLAPGHYPSVLTREPGYSYVGIFGTQLAQSLALSLKKDLSSNPKIAAEFKRLWKIPSNNKLAVIDLSLPQSSFPGHFAALAHFVEDLDVIFMIIDESAFADENYPQFPLEFPQKSSEFFSFTKTKSIPHQSFLYSIVDFFEKKMINVLNPRKHFPSYYQGQVFSKEQREDILLDIGRKYWMLGQQLTRAFNKRVNFSFVSSLESDSSFAKKLQKLKRNLKGELTLQIVRNIDELQKIVRGES